MFWSVHEGRGRTPFLSTKGHEGQRRKPLQGHVLVYPRRAGKNTFFVHEGPRRTMKKTFVRSCFGLSTKGGGEHLFCPRRATKDHEENLRKVMFWSVHEGRGRTPFLSTKGREENHFKIIIWSVLEGPLRAMKKTFCSRRRSWSSITRIARETVRFCPQASCFLSHCEQSYPNVNGTW